MSKQPTAAPLTQVAFLRAINVGGHRVTNDELAAPIKALGFDAVAPYQASGNLLLSGVDAADPKPIETALEETFGYAVPTMIRSAARVQAIAEATPFDEETLAATAGKVQVMFLHHPPTTEEQSEIQSRESPNDQIVIDGTEVYWLPTQGISTSTLKVDTLNRAVGPLTIRTQATVARIAKKLD